MSVSSPMPVRWGTSGRLTWAVSCAQAGRGQALLLRVISSTSEGGSARRRRSWGRTPPRRPCRGCPWGRCPTASMWCLHSSANVSTFPLAAGSASDRGRGRTHAAGAALGGRGRAGQAPAGNSLASVRFTHCGCRLLAEFRSHSRRAVQDDRHLLWEALWDVSVAQDVQLSSSRACPTLRTATTTQTRATRMLLGAWGCRESSLQAHRTVSAQTAQIRPACRVASDACLPGVPAAREGAGR